MRLTRHAIDRWRQRGGSGGLDDAAENAVRIPQRYACAGLTHRGGNARKQRHHGVSYAVCATGMLILRGNRVVTVAPLEVAGLATVLVWLMTGVWEG